MKRILLSIALLVAVAALPASAGKVPRFPRVGHASIQFSAPAHAMVGKARINPIQVDSREVGHMEMKVTVFDFGKFHVFHFTSLWWAAHVMDHPEDFTWMDQQNKAEWARVYSVMKNQFYNDLVYDGAPRELITLDEPQ